MYNKELQKVKEELIKLRKPIYNVNVKHKESLSALEKIAVKVTDYVGSMGFFLIILFFFFLIKSTLAFCQCFPII